MIIAILTVLGLIWGSFVNALTWRLYEREELIERESKNKKKLKSKNTLTMERLSIWKSRSMCPNCHHELAAIDLIPLVSWLLLGGKCRYCHKPISAQYPLVEALMAFIFVISYIFWPLSLIGGVHIAVFGLWLGLVVILLALVVYDFRWQLLPNKLVTALVIIAIVQAIFLVIGPNNHDPVWYIVNYIVAITIGGGLFYLIFLISGGKWIGGGDVKLGLVLGLIVGTPSKSLLMLFLAALAGTIVSLPLLASKRLKRTSAIPFGPFLILATIIVVLFGQSIISWYVSLYMVGP